MAPESHMSSGPASTRRLGTNIVASMLGMGISALVSIWLTPLIVADLGAAAYSLIPLAAQITMYFSLATVAVNSMSSRFVVHELHSLRGEEANVYFSTAFVANVAALVLLTPAILVIVAYSDTFLDVPAAFVVDFRLLLGLSFIGFCASLFASVYSIRLFAGNAFAAQSLINVIGVLVRAGVILGLFATRPPSLAYVGVATACSALLVATLTRGTGRRLTPSLGLSFGQFRISAAVKLVRAGVWALLSQVSLLLLSGASLLIANIWLGADGAAPYAVALTIPNLVSGVIAAVSSVFVPTLIREQATGGRDELLRQLRLGNHVVSSVVCLIVAALVVFGEVFYGLWVPSMNSGELQALTLLIIAPMAAFSAHGCLFSVYTVLNRLRLSAIVTLIAGIVSVIGTVFILESNVASPPILAVPLASGVIMVLVNGIYHPLTISRLLGVKSGYFLLENATFMLWLGGLSFIGWVTIRVVGDINDWPELIVAGLAFVAAGGLAMVLRIVGAGTVFRRIGRAVRFGGS